MFPLEATEDGVGLGDGESVRLLRVEDGKEKGDDGPGAFILAVFQAVPFLGVHLPVEHLPCEIVLTVGQPAAVLPELVNLLPGFPRPLLQICPDRFMELNGRVVHQFPHHGLLLESPRYRQQSGATHPLEVFSQDLDLPVSGWKLRSHLLERR